MKLSPSDIADLERTIILPLSKSVRARELLLDAVYGRDIDIEWDNDDIFVLSSALRDIQIGRGSGHDVVLNIHDSGTALRFLTAFCAANEGNYVLFGSKRLSERPVSGLVDVLSGMGADITYLKEVGHAPLRIVGKKLSGGVVSVDASVSSQFVSALMLVSPLIPEGLDIKLQGDIVSSKYIGLTDYVISQYNRGILHSKELDWSSASVWFGVVALSEGVSIKFKNLFMETKQPDSAIVDIFSKFGVLTEEQSDGILIRNSGRIDMEFVELDGTDIPDAILYLVVTACILNIRFVVHGVSTLRVKECDRVSAITCELKKCGYVLYDNGDSLSWEGERCVGCEDLFFSTYNDHRMAMSLSLFGLSRNVQIDDPSVVEKSYPDFWNEFVKFVNIE